jgi:hypothetical protein
MIGSLLIAVIVFPLIISPGQDPVVFIPLKVLLMLLPVTAILLQLLRITAVAVPSGQAKTEKMQPVTVLSATSLRTSPSPPPPAKLHPEKTQFLVLPPALNPESISTAARPLAAPAKVVFTNLLPMTKGDFPGCRSNLTAGPGAGPTGASKNVLFTYKLTQPKRLCFAVNRKLDPPGKPT